MRKEIPLGSTFPYKEELLPQKPYTKEELDRIASSKELILQAYDNPDKTIWNTLVEEYRKLEKEYPDNFLITDDQQKMKAKVAEIEKDAFLPEKIFILQIDIDHPKIPKGTPVVTVPNWPGWQKWRQNGEFTYIAQWVQSTTTFHGKTSFHFLLFITLPEISERLVLKFIPENEEHFALLTYVRNGSKLLILENAELPKVLIIEDVPMEVLYNLEVWKVTKKKEQEFIQRS